MPMHSSYNIELLVMLAKARKCTQIISRHLPVLLETGYLDLLENDELEKMSQFYQEILDEDTIRFKPTIEIDLDFDQFLFSELSIASKELVIFTCNSEIPGIHLNETLWCCFRLNDGCFLKITVFT